MIHGGHPRSKGGVNVPGIVPMVVSHHIPATGVDKAQQTSVKWVNLRTGLVLVFIFISDGHMQTMTPPPALTA